MAKDNLFLGYARGKVGDVVFSRLNGQQVSRARNRAPRNPRSVLQIAQRTIMKTNSLAYSYLQAIANHSFEGFAEGMECQQRFSKLNVAQMRAQVADVLQSGSDDAILECDEFNFTNKQELLPVLRPYIISEGSLKSVSSAATFSQDGTTTFITLTPANSLTGDIRRPTYAEVCSLLGLDRGDQLTFCVLRWTGGSFEDSPCFNQMVTCRVVLEPADGDMSHQFYPSTGNTWVNPRDIVPDNWIFSVSVGEGENSFVAYVPIPQIDDDLTEGAFGGHAVILSRKAGDIWLRSNETFHIPNTILFQGAQFGMAVRSWMSDKTSTLYLNQSE